MEKVLFICNHNSARSQMAEALLKQACGEFLEVASAGMKPGALKPFYHACAFGTWITINTARNKKSASIFRQQRQQG